VSDSPGLLPLARRLLAYPLPKGVSWTHVFGGLLLASFLIQVVTGALLALVYSPSAGDAWESVRYIEDEVRAGSLIRGVHHFGSSSFVILLVLHVARTFIWGAYKAPRAATWIVGCLLLGCVLAFGFTGYLLPWDLKAFFGTRVGVGIAGSAPVLGHYLKTLLAGGPSVGELTLPRFYAVHAVILPLVTSGLIVLHIVLLRMHGVTPHWRHGYVASGRTFHPHQTAKDLAAGLLLLLCLLALARFVGAPLEEKADPLNTTYVPRPEWYFLGAQQLLRIFQGRAEVLGSFVLPSAGAALLLLLPWLDRGPSRAPRDRRGVLAAGAALLLLLVGLSVWGHRELRAEERAMAQRVAARAAVDAEGPAEGAAAPAQPGEGDAALAQRGAELYRALACGACHGELLRVPDAPSLAFEGSVVQPAWLRGYLEDPVPIRLGFDGGPLETRMPDFELAEPELDALVAHLATRLDPARFSDAPFTAAPAAGAVERGRALFDELECRACHVLAGDGDPVGPGLDTVGRRLRPGYVVGLLLDPEDVVPGTSMTDFQLGEDDAQAIAQYLMTLK
jgi:ubiquinol-cytochrome c reductase cytochrome b subunit